MVRLQRKRAACFPVFASLRSRSQMYSTGLLCLLSLMPVASATTYWRHTIRGTLPSPPFMFHSAPAFTPVEVVRVNFSTAARSGYLHGTLRGAADVKVARLIVVYCRETSTLSVPPSTFAGATLVQLSAEAKKNRKNERKRTEKCTEDRYPPRDMSSCCTTVTPTTRSSSVSCIITDYKPRITPMTWCPTVNPIVCVCVVFAG